MDAYILAIKNNQPIPLQECPLVKPDFFKHLVHRYIEQHNAHISALFCVPVKEKQAQLFCVLNNNTQGEIGIVSTFVPEQYPALTPDIPQAHWFEREIFETRQITPLGHPWLKPIRSLFPAEGNGKDFFMLEGEGVHEVAVGPVHAGVIEPGHFRFQCHGETVYHLEISLGYQHRGVEKAVSGGPDKKTLHYMETLAGDTTAGHTTAYCQVVEALSGSPVSLQAECIRSIAAELERLANHIGDLGALAGDVGFLPSQNYCGRIRGDALNLTGELCGNRFSRGLIIPGGVSAVPDQKVISRIQKKLDNLEKDFENAAGLIFTTPSVLARFEGIGAISHECAARIGLVGMAARASGLARDIRSQHPYGRYQTRKIPAATCSTGDCYARAYIRLLEARASITFIRRQLASLPMDSYTSNPACLKPDQLVVSLVECWRGETCHIAATGENSSFAFYKIVDPSFHNWFGLAYALRNQQISDFPLCNKSFNLSYCGHDL